MEVQSSGCGVCDLASCEKLLSVVSIGEDTGDVGPVRQLFILPAGLGVIGIGGHTSANCEKLRSGGSTGEVGLVRKLLTLPVLLLAGDRRLGIGLADLLPCDEYRSLGAISGLTT